MTGAIAATLGALPTLALATVLARFGEGPSYSKPACINASVKSLGEGIPTPDKLYRELDRRQFAIATKRGISR